MRFLPSNFPFLFVAVAFLLGSTLGFWFRSKLPTEAQSAASDGHLSDPAAFTEIVPKPLEAAQPIQASASAKEQARDAEMPLDYGEIFVRLEAEGLRLVPKKVLFHLIKNPAQPNRPVLREIAAALRLSPTETDRAEAAVKTVEMDLAALEMERTERVSVQDNEVKFRIHPFPAEGARLRNRLRVELTDILGETKGNLFVELIDEHVAYFDDFGATPLEARFMIVNHGPEPQAHYSIRRVLGDDSISRWVFSLDRLKPVANGRHGHLLRQLPPELRIHFTEPQ